MTITITAQSDKVIDFIDKNQGSFLKQQIALLALIEANYPVISSITDQLFQSIAQGFTLAQAYQLLNASDQNTLCRELGSKTFNIILNLSKSSDATAGLLQAAKSWDEGGQQNLALQALAILQGEGNLVTSPVYIREQATTLKNAILLTVGAGSPRPMGAVTAPLHSIYRSIRDVGHAAQDPQTVLSLVVAGRLAKLVQGGVASLGESVIAKQFWKLSGLLTGVNVEAGVFTVSQMLPAWISRQARDDKLRLYRDDNGGITWKSIWEDYKQNLVMVGSLRAGAALGEVAAVNVHGIGSSGVATRYLEYANATTAVMRHASSFGGLYLSSAIQDPAQSISNRLFASAEATVAYGLAGVMGRIAMGATHMSLRDERSESWQPINSDQQHRSLGKLEMTTNAVEMTILGKTNSWFSTFLGPNFATATAGGGHYRAERTTTARDDAKGLGAIYVKGSAREGKEHAPKLAVPTANLKYLHSLPVDYFYEGSIAQHVYQAGSNAMIDGLPVAKGTIVEFYQDSAMPRCFYAGKNAKVNGIPAKANHKIVFYPHGQVNYFTVDQGGKIGDIPILPETKLEYHAHNSTVSFSAGHEAVVDGTLIKPGSLVQYDKNGPLSFTASSNTTVKGVPVMAGSSVEYYNGQFVSFVAGENAIIANIVIQPHTQVVYYENGNLHRVAAGGGNQISEIPVAEDSDVFFHPTISGKVDRFTAAENTTYRGVKISSNSIVELYPNGQVQFFTAGEKTIINDIPVKMESRVKYYENGGVKSLTAGEDAEINGVKVKPESPIEYLPNGQVHSFVAGKDAEIYGIKVKVNTKVEFYNNGRVAKFVAGLGAKFNGMNIKPGSEVQFASTGMLAQFVVGDGAKWSGLPLEPETNVIFSNTDAFPAVLTVNNGAKINGIPVAPVSEVSYHANGKVVSFVADEGAILQGIPVRAYSVIFYYHNGSPHIMTAGENAKIKGIVVLADSKIEFNSNGQVAQFTAGPGAKFKGTEIAEGTKILVTSDGEVVVAE